MLLAVASVDHLAHVPVGAGVIGFDSFEFIPQTNFWLLPCTNVSIYQLVHNLSWGHVTMQGIEGVSTAPSE